MCRPAGAFPDRQDQLEEAVWAANEDHFLEAAAETQEDVNCMEGKHNCHVAPEDMLLQALDCARTHKSRVSRPLQGQMEGGPRSFFCPVRGSLECGFSAHLEGKTYNASHGRLRNILRGVLSHALSSTSYNVLY